MGIFRSIIPQVLKRLFRFSLSFSAFSKIEIKISLTKPVKTMKPSNMVDPSKKEINAVISPSLMCLFVFIISQQFGGKAMGACPCLLIAVMCCSSFVFCSSNLLIVFLQISSFGKCLAASVSGFRFTISRIRVR